MSLGHGELFEYREIEVCLTRAIEDTLARRAERIDRRSREAGDVEVTIQSSLCTREGAIANSIWTSRSAVVQRVA